MSEIPAPIYWCGFGHRCLFNCTLFMDDLPEYPHVRLPKKADRILLIISEELRNNRFFNKIEKIGFDDYSARSHFTFLVLDLIFGEAPDELAELYLKLLEKYTRKLKDNRRKSIIKQAFNFYIDLLIEKKRRIPLTHR